MKFVRLGNYVVNVSQIQLLQRVGNGCKIYMIDGSEYNIATVSDETYESAIAYICLSSTYGGVNFEQTNKR